MKDPLTDYEREFEELAGDLSQTVRDMSDPVAIATMLYSIAEERKNNNLVVRDINAKFDTIVERLKILEKIVEKLETITNQLNELNRLRPEVKTNALTELSDKDQEILDFVSKHEKVCADDIKKEFNYKGRNAASARLSKLFKDNMLEKVYVGRKVYYKTRTPD